VPTILEDVLTAAQNPICEVTQVKNIHMNAKCAGFDKMICD
jgi:hypothetical protein